MPVSGNVNRVNCNQIHINRVGRIRIRIIIRILRYGINAVFSSLPPPYPNSVFPYIRIYTAYIRQQFRIRVKVYADEAKQRKVTISRSAKNQKRRAASAGVLSLWTKDSPSSYDSGRLVVIECFNFVLEGQKK